MRIAIDGTTLCDKNGGRGAGIEHYTWSIIATMIQRFPEYVFVISVPESFTESHQRQLVGQATNVRFITPILPSVRFLSRHVFLPFRLKLSKPDVLFSPSGQVPWGWFWESVITVHDLAIYEHPEWFSGTGNQDFAIRVVVPNSIEQKSKAIIAVSQATMQQIERLFPSAKGKIKVVYEGVEPIDLLPEELPTDRFPYERDYIFYLGTLEPRKNLPMAMRAFDRFLTEHPEQVQQTRFVLAGKFGWDTKEIEEMANEVNKKWSHEEPDGVIQALGHVSEQEKWLLLAQASAFIFPSHYEGFGLPILEAMQAGVPVITTPCGALSEVGGDAVMYVQPDDIEKMSFAIAQCLLVPDGVNILRVDGLQQARKFTWKKAAEKTMEVLVDVINSSKDK